MKTKQKQSKQSALSTKSAHKEMKKLFVKTLEEKPSLLANKTCPAYPTLSALKKGWLSVAQILNSSGIIKNHTWTAFGARKKWTDLRYVTRKRALAVEKLKKKGISEIPLNLKLRPIDRRILALASLPTSRDGESTSFTSLQNEDGFTSRITDVRTQQESSDADDSASDCSMDEPDDRIEKNGSIEIDEPDDRIEKNDTTRNTSILREDGKFKEFFGLQRSKLDIRKEELLIKKEKLELKKQKIALMKNQLTVQTNTLNQLKAICALMEKE